MFLISKGFSHSKFKVIFIFDINPRFPSVLVYDAGDCIGFLISLDIGLSDFCQLLETGWSADALAVVSADNLYLNINSGVVFGKLHLDFL